jgi:hypothetical protein
MARIRRSKAIDEEGADPVYCLFAAGGPPTMQRSIRRGTSAGAALACLLATANASALMLEQPDTDHERGQYVYFYPYPTTYQHIDDAYAFDDDPLAAFVVEPLVMPIVVKPPSVLRSMVQPRTSFVHEMYQSAEVL